VAGTATAATVVGAAATTAAAAAAGMTAAATTKWATSGDVTERLKSPDLAVFQVFDRGTPPPPRAKLPRANMRLTPPSMSPKPYF